MAKTVKERVDSQRTARQRANWVEVRLWVPSQGDADAVKKLGADRRALAQQLPGLERLSVPGKEELIPRVREAVRQQGSKAYVTPSGPILDLLSALADTGNIGDMSQAYAIFARAYPMNAHFVAHNIPAKVLSRHLARVLPNAPLDRISSLVPDWQQRLIDTLGDDAAFAAQVSHLHDALRAATPKEKSR